MSALHLKGPEVRREGGQEDLHLLPRELDPGLDDIGRPVYPLAIGGRSQEGRVVWGRLPRYIDSLVVTRFQFDVNGCLLFYPKWLVSFNPH